MKITPRPPLGAAVAAVFAVAFLGPRPAAAWSAHGHSTIGQIAQDLLTKSAPSDPSAQAALAGIAALMNAASDPAYVLPPDALAALAPCADMVRVEPGEGSYPAVTPGEQVTCAGLTFTAEAASKDWHYVNIPISAPATADSAAAYCPAGDCVVDEIKRAVSDLQTSTVLDDRRKSLMYLVHFVGDLHQPLHCATEIVCPPGIADKAKCKNDDGGNGKLVKFDGTTLKLHALWDHLFEADDKSNDPAAISKELEGELPADPSAWTSGDFVTDAAVESFSIAQGTIYPNYHQLAAGGQTPAYSDADHDQMLSLIDGRLERGGVRLAALLKQAFSAGPAAGASAPAQAAPAAPASANEARALDNSRHRVRRTEASGAQ